MTDFETSAALSIELDQRSLREVRSELESELGDVSVGVSGGGAAATMTDGGRSGNLADRLDTQSDLLSDQLDVLEDIESELGTGGLLGSGGSGGGGGTGLLPTGGGGGGGGAGGFLGALGLGGLAGRASGLLGGLGKLGGVSAAGSAIFDSNFGVKQSDEIGGGILDFFATTTARGAGELGSILGDAGSSAVQGLGGLLSDVPNLAPVGTARAETQKFRVPPDAPNDTFDPTPNGGTGGGTLDGSIGRGDPSGNFDINPSSDGGGSDGPITVDESLPGAEAFAGAIQNLRQQQGKPQVNVQVKAVDPREVGREVERQTRKALKGYGSNT